MVIKDDFDEKFHTGRSELLKEPIEQLELPENMTVSQLVERFTGMSVQARNLGKAARIWERMLTDKARPTIFLGLTGPLIAAGLRNVLAGLIRHRLVDVVVSTGAIIYQDYLYSLGGEHYKGFINVDNKKLRELRINRIYDVFSDDLKFEEADDEIDKFTRTLPPGNYSSRQFISELAKTVTDERSILKASHDAGVPIFIPALNG